MKLDIIHTDSRGSINCLTGEELTSCPEITIFHTKKGHARGGCIHYKSQEMLVVIEGTIEYYCMTSDNGELSEFKAELTKGQTIIIEANIPHYFIALTDCVVAEWGPQLDEKKAKDEYYRTIVDSINKTMVQESNDV